MEDFWIWLTALLTGGSILLTVALPVCICGLTIVLAGGIWLIVDRTMFRPARQAKQAAQAWPATTGVVLESYVNTETSYDSSSNSNTTQFKPYVVYEYTVNGRRFRSDHIQVSDSFYTMGMLPGSAQGVVNRYPVGANVTVYYNPTNPEEATLER